MSRPEIEGISVMKAGRGDVIALAELQCRSMRMIAAAHYRPAQIEAFLAAATPSLFALVEDGTVWLARHEDRLLASAAWHLEGAVPTLGRNPVRDPATAVFRAVYVEPGWTRRGLASMMMDQAESDARSHGVRRASLHAMLGAVEFYRARGYASVGETIFDLGGIEFPGVEMTHTLDEATPEAA